MKCDTKIPKYVIYKVERLLRIVVSSNFLRQIPLEEVEVNLWTFLCSLSSISSSLFNRVPYGQYSPQKQKTRPVLKYPMYLKSDLTQVIWRPPTPTKLPTFDFIISINFLWGLMLLFWRVYGRRWNFLERWNLRE